MPVSLLIKPASSLCNMRCDYCFYHDVASKRNITSYGIMTSETMEDVIRNIFATASGSCHFAFQGGEPTLAGLDYFREFLDLEKKYNKNKLSISHSIQTNGYAIDTEWAEFFAQNKFLVGLSLDGNKEVNDLYRKDIDRKGSYSKIMRAVQLFKNKGVSYNVLTVVTGNTVSNIGKIYHFFCNNGFTYQQYIPCLEPLDSKPNQQTYSLTASQYGEFLKQLFNLWYADWKRGKPISIRYFDNLVGILLGYPPESCGMTGRCSCQNVVEADGSVYPCDFYVLDQYRIGNLRTENLKEIQRRGEATEFIKSSYSLPDDCKKCKWLPLCRGGCRREREVPADGQIGKNRYCTAYQNFFEYAIERLTEIAHKVRRY